MSKIAGFGFTALAAIFALVLAAGLAHVAHSAILFVGDGGSGNVIPVNPDGTLGAVMTTSATSINALALDASTNTIYVGDYGTGNVIPVNTLSDAVGANIVTGAKIVALSFFSGNEMLYVANGASGNVIPINVITGSVGANIVTGASAIGFGDMVLDSADNTLYVGASNTGNIIPINMISNTAGANIVTSAGAVGALLFDSTNGILYVGDLDSGNVITVNVVTPLVTANIPMPVPGISALTFNPATHILYAGERNGGTVVPFNTLSHGFSSSLPTGLSAISSMVMTPTGILYVGDYGTGSVISVNTLNNDAMTNIATGAASSRALLFDPTAINVNLHISSMQMHGPITYGQTATPNIIITGGLGPYTANLVWCRLDFGTNPPACVTPYFTAGTNSLANSITVALPSDGNNDGILTYTVNAVSYNTLRVTFNSISYNLILPSYIPGTNSIVDYMTPGNAVFANTIYGGWGFNGVVTDTGSGHTMALWGSQGGPVLGINPANPTLQYLAAGGFVAFVSNYGNNTVSKINIVPTNIPASNVVAALAVGQGPKALVAPSGQISAAIPSYIGTVNYLSDNLTMINTVTMQTVQVPGGMDLGVGTGPIAVAAVSNNINSGGMAFAEYGTNNVVIMMPPAQGSTSFKSFNISLSNPPSGNAIIGPDAMDVYSGGAGSVNTISNTVSATLWVVGKLSNNIVPINLTTMLPGNSIYLGNGAEPTSVLATPFGFVFVADYGTNTISVINASSADPGVIATISGPGNNGWTFNGPYSMTMDPSQPEFFVTNYDSNSVVVVDPFSYQIKGGFTVSNSPVSAPDAVSGSPDGKLLYISNFGTNTIAVANTLDNYNIIGVLPANEPTGITVFSNFFYNGTVPNNVVFSITSPGNQLTGNLIMLGANGQVPIGDTTNTISNTVAAGAHSYAYIFSTMGNANYTPSVIFKEFNIIPSFPHISMTMTVNTIVGNTVVNLDSQGATNTLSVYANQILSVTLTANIDSFGGQLPANVFLSNTVGAAPASANSMNFNGLFSITYNALTLPAGIQTFVFNSVGNGNYIPVDPQIHLHVLTTSTTSTTTIPQGGDFTGGGVGNGNPGATTTKATTTVPATNPKPNSHVLLNSTYNLTAGSNKTVNVGANITVTVYAPAAASVGLTVANITNRTGYSAPDGSTPLIMINVGTASSANVVTTVTLGYNCSLPASSIRPYELMADGSWSTITPYSVNASSCKVSFAVPPDPVVGLFYTMPVTSSTTVATTTLQVTTVAATTTAAQQPTFKGSSSATIAAAVAIIAIAALAVLLARKRRR